MPTIRDVARRAGVAPITVSRVINNSGYVSGDARLRVEEAIEALQYIPNGLSQSLRFKKTNIIALVVSDITNPFWTTVTRGVEDATSEHGLNVVLCNTDEKQSKLDNYIHVLLQKRIDGILLVPTGDNADVVRKIQKQHIPVVLLDRILPDLSVDVVRSDSEGGSYALTRFLIQQGHRHIAMLAGPTEISTSTERIAGYRRALEEFEIPFETDLVSSGGYNHESGFHRAQNLLIHPRLRPTAMYAGNNVIAVGVLQALYRNGLRVPEDMSVVSFDDLPISVLPEPFLTVVAQSPYELGVASAQLLIDLITGKQQPGSRNVVLPIELIVRQSCRVVDAVLP